MYCMNSRVESIGCSRVKRPTVATVSSLLWQVGRRKLPEKDLISQCSNLSMLISKCTKFMHSAVETPWFVCGRMPPDPPTVFGLSPKILETPLSHRHPISQWDQSNRWHAAPCLRGRYIYNVSERKLIQNTLKKTPRKEKRNRLWRAVKI